MDLKHPQVLQAWFNLDRDELKDKYNCIVTTKKSGRWFWKILDRIYWALSGFKKSDFMKRATTIGGLIAFGEDTDLKHVTEDDYLTLKHEAVHVKQCSICGLCDPYVGALIFLILYLFVPLPAWRSWFRFKFEREAFLKEYQLATRYGYKIDIEIYVKALSGPSYLWAWPEKKVRAWFRKEILKPTN